VILFIVVVGGYFLVKGLLDEENGSLVASGTIEAIDVTISPELGGRIAEVFVSEGDMVQTGVVLFRLDDSVYQAQRQVTEANLDLARAALSTAQAQYAIALAAARTESAGNRLPVSNTQFSDGYSLPGWYFSQAEQVSAARAEVESILAGRDGAQQALDDLLRDPANADFLAAEMDLLEAREVFLIAQDVLNRIALATDGVDLRSTAQDAYDQAREDLEDAQAVYDDLTNSGQAEAILSARLEVAVAQERYEAAQDRLLTLQTGVHSLRVVAAEAAVEQASMTVVQAEASLALIDAQIVKLTATAPADGVVLTCTIQPGEFVAPGALALILGRINELTITVYVPEDRYGEISVGQEASVSVDSFPEEVFSANVVDIADQAEFTPRNVQTEEGRKTTVFAVRLQVVDPQGKLKPGMPADVVFNGK